MTRNRSGFALAIAGGLAAVVLGGGTVVAHDDIASSTPASGSTIDDPISEVTIDFGEEVADVEMALLGPGDELIEPTETVLVNPTTATIQFPELDQQGVYIVRYLAPVVRDGHTLAGAIQFTYGSAGGSNTGPLLVFAAAAIVVLSTGAFFSWRRYQALAGSEVDEDLADVGV